MKTIVGGYYPGSGTYGDPYQLPEVVVYGKGPYKSCQAFYNQPGFFDYQAGNPIIGSFLTYFNLLVHTCGGHK